MRTFDFRSAPILTNESASRRVIDMEHADHSFGHITISDDQYERIQSILQEGAEPPRQFDLCAVCGSPIFDTEMYKIHESGETIRFAHSRCP